jgi:hypothetical protein
MPLDPPRAGIRASKLIFFYLFEKNFYHSNYPSNIYGHKNHQISENT